MLLLLWWCIAWHDGFQCPTVRLLMGSLLKCMHAGVGASAPLPLCPHPSSHNNAALLPAHACCMCVNAAQVVVTGAGGRTGGLITKQLLADKERFSSIKATVRSKKSPPSQLLSAGLTDGDVIEFDLAAAAAAAEGAAAAEQEEQNMQRLKDALKDADTLVICTR